MIICDAFLYGMEYTLLCLERVDPTSHIYAHLVTLKYIDGYFRS